EDELGELPGGEEREPAALADPTEREAPIALEAVPAHRRGLERLAAHRLHRVAEDRFDLADFDSHDRAWMRDPGYSSRSAFIGSTRLARRAGTKVASVAARARTAIAAPQATGSFGLTWKRRLATRRVPRTAAPPPRTRPAPVRSAPSRA